MSDPFTTGVVNGDGLWPGEPERMSYSSLREIEECPRRWMLRRARYPQVWDRAGYPDSPSIASLFGDVVHTTLERVLHEVVANGCESLESPCAVSAMQHCGGYGTLIDAILEAKLAELAKNPRLGERLFSIRSTLRLRRPELRQRVQLMVSRSKFSLSGPVRGGGEIREQPDRTPVGSLAEVELRPEALSWTGRADLITVTPNSCTIVDYKTGIPHESHAEQLQIYALLWFLDRSRNPSKMLATELVIAYSTHDVAVRPPSDEELRALEARVRSRTEQAVLALRKRPPVARPSTEICDGCSVRHLCPEYWQFLGHREIAATDATVTQKFGDVELQVDRRHGPRSWAGTVVSTVSGRSAHTVRLQAKTDSLNFAPGSVVRLLNVGIERDDETRTLVLTMNQNTEVFRLRPSAV